MVRTHNQYVHARPCGDGEWVAEIKEAGLLLATAYGLSRRQAIFRARKEVGPAKRFKVKSHSTSKIPGWFFEVTDYEKDKVWSASRKNCNDAIKAVERHLPMAYFEEQPNEHGHSSSGHTWKDYHAGRFFLIPLTFMVIVYYCIFWA